MLPNNDFNVLRGPLQPNRETREQAANRDEMERLARKLSGDLASALDMTIRQWVSVIEQRDVPLSEIAHGVSMIRLSSEPPQEWECFVIWRRNAMAYRVIQESHVNEGSNQATFDATLQTLPLIEDDWPETVREFIDSNGKASP